MVGATPSINTVMGHLQNKTMLREHTLRTELLPGTYVFFVTFHIVCEGRAGEFVSTKEAEVTRYLSGYGGGEALEEALWPFVPHNGFYHRPHSASNIADRVSIQYKETTSALWLLRSCYSHSALRLTMPSCGTMWYHPVIWAHADQHALPTL